MTTPTLKDLTTLHTAHLTDQGNAQRFLHQHRQHIRYLPSHGWFVYDGQRWQPDPNRLRVSQLALATINTLADDALALPTDQSPLACALLIHVHRCESPARITALLNLASTDPTIVTTLDAFDAHPHLLNLANGTLDLRTRELRPHDPTDLLTRLIPFEYHPGASSPIWNDFLDTLCNHDPHLRDYLQRAMGYTLSGTRDEDALFLLHGSGRNGKHTFLNAITHVLADYAHTTPLSTLTREHCSPTITYERSTLPAVRFLTASCTDPDQTLDLTSARTLTAADPIIVPRGRASYRFTPRFALWLTATHLPRITDPSASVWDRLKLIPFTHTFTDQRDRRLVAHLHEAAPAILTWLIQGHALWTQHGLLDPDVVRHATAAYREDQDLLAEFVRDCCTLGTDATAPAHELYLAYARWSRARNERPRSETAFLLDIQAHGYRHDRTNAGKYYHGLALIPPPEPPAAPIPPAALLPPYPDYSDRYPLDPSSVPGSPIVSPTLGWGERISPLNAPRRPGIAYPPDYPY